MNAQEANLEQRLTSCRWEMVQSAIAVAHGNPELTDHLLGYLIPLEVHIVEFLIRTSPFNLFVACKRFIQDHQDFNVDFINTCERLRVALYNYFLFLDILHEVADDLVQVPILY
jgi:hypothetical protein